MARRSSALDTIGRDALLRLPRRDNATQMLERTSDDPRFRFSRMVTMIARRFRTRLDERLKDVGQTQARWQTLFWIALSGKATTQREIADLIGVEGPTLVRTLNGLEEQGLVERVAVPEDRRAKALRLTEAAEPILSQIGTIVEELRNDMLQDVSDEELTAAVRVLEKIMARLDQC